jgi:hypothetical protein
MHAFRMYVMGRLNELAAKHYDRIVKDQAEKGGFAEAILDAELDDVVHDIAGAIKEELE